MAHCGCPHEISQCRRSFLVLCSTKRTTSTPQSHSPVENSPHTLQRSSTSSCSSPFGDVPVCEEDKKRSFLEETSEHCHFLCPRFFCWSALVGVTVLCCPFKARWWTSGGLICCRRDYFGVEYVDYEVSLERLALLPLAERSSTWVVRSPDGDEWPEDLSCVDPDSGPSRAWPFPRVGQRPRRRRRLYAFRCWIADEPLRAALVRRRLPTRACFPLGWLREGLATR